MEKAVFEDELRERVASCVAGKFAGQVKDDLFVFLTEEVQRLGGFWLKKSPDLRDDLTQEVMLSLLSVDLGELKHPRAYLATVVRRTAYRMSQDKHRHSELNEDRIEDRDDIADLDSLELLSKLRGVISNMKERCRKILDMLSFKSKSDTTLARELGIKSGTVPVSRARCLRGLHDTLQKEHHDLFEDLKEL